MTRTGTWVMVAAMLAGIGCSDYSTDGAAGYGTGGDRASVQDEEPQLCEEAPTDETTLYMSADDSNSQADPIYARWSIENGVPIQHPLRIYEFLNYYDFDFQPAEPGTVRIVPQIRQHKDDPDAYTLLVGVVAPEVHPAERRPLNVTFSLDTSGSMGDQGVAMTREVLLAMASELREGDVISIVEWSSSPEVVLDSYWVQGPDDPELVHLIEIMQTGGSTDLHAGLVKAYELATKNYSEDAINRVFLVSDGGANTGVTEEELIAQHADDGDGEGIYMVGVGCGNSYHHGLMDAVTDAGKGAFVFIDTAEEAKKMFTGERFLANMEVAARDVELAVTMPGGFLLEEFHGEEVSEDPAEVENQHLAPNDAMLYHQILRDCGAEHPGVASPTFTFSVVWEDPELRKPRYDEITLSLDEMLAGNTDQLEKADVIVDYAKALSELPELDFAGKNERFDGVYETVELLLDANPDDENLTQIMGTLDRYAEILQLPAGCGHGTATGARVGLPALLGLGLAGLLLRRRRS